MRLIVGGAELVAGHVYLLGYRVEASDIDFFRDFDGVVDLDAENVRAFSTNKVFGRNASAQAAPQRVIPKWLPPPPHWCEMLVLQLR